jgi:hypothetical protein
MYNIHVIEKIRGYSGYKVLVVNASLLGRARGGISEVKLGRLQNHGHK